MAAVRVEVVGALCAITYRTEVGNFLAMTGVHTNVVVVSGSYSAALTSDVLVVELVMTMAGDHFGSCISVR